MTDIFNKVSSASNKELIYFFSDDFVEKHPKYFYKEDETIYTTWDNTKVYTIPKRFSSKDNDEYVYVVPSSEYKPIKFVYEGYTDEI